MKSPKLLWLIPPSCGIAGVMCIYALIFSGLVDGSEAAVRFFEGSFGWVLWLVEVLKIGPYGCDGMIWFGIAPGIAWFAFGTLLGTIIAFALHHHLKETGRLKETISPRRLTAEIQAHPEYEKFVQEDPERRYLYHEQLPAEFDEWLKRRRG